MAPAKAFLARRSPLKPAAALRRLHAQKVFGNSGTVTGFPRAEIAICDSYPLVTLVAVVTHAQVVFCVPLLGCCLATNPSAAWGARQKAKSAATAAEPGPGRAPETGPELAREGIAGRGPGQQAPGLSAQGHRLRQWNALAGRGIAQGRGQVLRGRGVLGQGEYGRPVRHSDSQRGRANWLPTRVDPRWRRAAV